MAIKFTYQPPKVDARAVLATVAATAANAGAEQLLRASQPHVPVEEAVLLHSGRVVSDGLHAYVTYGRDDDGTPGHAPSNDYVLVQHEDYALNHPNGGEAGFLLKPFRSESRHIIEAMVVLLRKVFR